jgi:hypothetical protein
MAKSNSAQLFKAAKAGDVGRIRELLAAGAPLEATDLNRMTPLMLAAQAGQADAFRALVEAGANLHTIALCDTDVLEGAAEGGNVEIIRFLLDKGMPVEGHWQPGNDVARRSGHQTPLISAAISCRVEAVKLLLEAGADRNAKFDGQTALQSVKAEIKFPLLAETPEEKQGYKQIAALLAEDSAGATSNEQSAELEVKKFAANAKNPGYEPLRRMLADLCGKSRPWKPAPDHGIKATDAVVFSLRDCKKEKTLVDLQEQARAAGFHLVLTAPWAAGEEAELVLFPTADKFAVVAAVGTEGANHSVQTADVIAWLRELDEKNPFALRFCSHELVGGAFLGPIKGTRILAERIVDFCPSVLDEGFETPAELVLVLGRRKAFLLRWD